MSKITALIAIALLVACSGNNSKSIMVETDLEKEGLKGKVESVVAKKYKAIEKDGAIETAGFGCKEKYCFDRLKKYDKYGLCYEEIKYDKIGKPAFFFNKHNDKGNLLTRTAKNAEDQLVFTLYYTYNDKGENIETKRIGAKGEVSGHWLKEYDSNGFLIESTELDADSTVKFTNVYINDSVGNMLDRTRSTGKGRRMHQLVYTYDDLGRVVEENEFHQPFFNKPSFTRTYTYNKNNLVISEVESSNIKEIKSAWSFEYDYDENQNWIRQRQYENDTVKYLVERTITYY